MLTVQDALPPHYLALEPDVEEKIIAAAIRAGWSAEDAVTAIEEMAAS